MNRAGLYPWGHHSLSLFLPGLAVNLTGLSDLQLSRFQSDYAAFLEPVTDAPGEMALQAVRHETFRPPHADKLTRDGQYAPIKSGHSPDGGFDLTGINFTARLQPAGGPPGFIGVTEEQHLAQANVFENVLRVLCAYSATHQGGVMLHSAGVVHEGRAWIFCGRSNAGKTTLATKAHAAGFGILSDDINLLLPCAAGFHAHAVPFTGEFGRTLERTLSGAFPVAATVLLQQVTTLTTERASAARATAALLAGCPFVNDDERETDNLLDTVRIMAGQAPVIQLTSALADDIGAIMGSVQSTLDEFTHYQQAQAL